jgi:two-component system, OmpR family, sensor histidine kinase QseC
MIRPSLNRRLVLRLVAGIVLVWCVAAGWMAWRSLHEVDEIFDQMLVRTAASVLAVMPDAPAQGRMPHLPERAIMESDPTAQRPAINLRDTDGQWVIRSPELPALAFDPGQAHFHTVLHRQRRWRVFQRWDSHQRYWIQVAAPLDERDELLRKLRTPALLALLALLVLVPPTVFAGLRSGLKPLRQLAASLSAAGPDTGTLTDACVPLELAPFTEAIDQLVARLRQSLEHERRFTADAAHELRHPLAALRLELDLAARDEDATTRALHVERANAALDRMHRLVAQLLLLARVEKLTELDDAGPLRLRSVAEAALREASERAAARSIELSLDHDGNDFVLGSRGLLDIALQNLLDNALRHTPDHGQVNVRVGGHAERVTLEVNDSGAGFAAADIARLGERFHRPEGSLGEGSGLGLSIVRTIASLHHGQLSFGRSGLGGAQVGLSLPRIAGGAPHVPGYV